MDMGLRGKSAIVCASSKGLGRGCAFSLAREGVNLVITARGKEALEKTAEEIRAATGVKVTAVAGDITNVNGTSTATAMVALSPGSAPMTVPAMTPPRASKKLSGVSASSKKSIPNMGSRFQRGAADPGTGAA